MATVNPIGLDIGSMSIRAVETARGKDGPVITNSGMVPLPPGAVQGGVVHDAKAVTAELKRLWSATKFRTRRVVIGVANPQLVVREMSVSNLPARELRRSLPFQVRDALPLPVERSLLDFFPLEDPGTQETVRGLLIAAPKEAVLTAVQAVEQAGLHVARVDLASFALLRAASRLDSQVEAIVDIGARSTSVIAHTDGVPLIVRTLPRGGAEVTETVAARLNVDVPTAEELKCRIGVREDQDGEEAAAAASVIREAVRPLIGEIRSSFAYLGSGSKPTRVTRMVLSGGGSLMPGLVEMLHAQLGIDVVPGDPTVRIRQGRRGKHDNLDRFRAAAAVSIGLAMGAAA
ncbi:pilus assembly protein PilM [Planomonospora parontospora subsp. parontospora]|uniref:Pilus assembly protein PilM n=2 Tax=Planomonospora parontospora TaxID=58119 RepID=A0AA37BE99_9ACTN|nr:type IV pilus assembly protein PilM [Planomonospora parontospora]GGK57165.1 pilus assembly protein PilM [Planomonospora parontospora]GII07738.1 pilus assembly protein PilM [Planomonospora parontospora subsp. parontospora]